jgi:hypothetical protein
VKYLNKFVIKIFCKENNTKKIDFAKKCGLSIGVINQYDYGYRLPNIRNMNILFNNTNGKINYDSFTKNKDNIPTSILTHPLAELSHEPSVDEEKNSQPVNILQSMKKRIRKNNPHTQLTNHPSGGLQ